MRWDIQKLRAMGINMNENKQDNKNISFGSQAGRLWKGVWACFSEKSKKRWKVFVGWKGRPEIVERCFYVSWCVWWGQESEPSWAPGPGRGSLVPLSYILFGAERVFIMFYLTSVFPPRKQKARQKPRKERLNPRKHNKILHQNPNTDAGRLKKGTSCW